MASRLCPIVSQSYDSSNGHKDESNCEKEVKKRTRNPENWKKEKRKKAILSGQAYVNTKGEVVGPRAIGPDCNCKHKCFLNVSQEQREKIFNGFYSLKSYDEQNAYLYGLIRRYDIQKKRKPISERRTCSYKYYVRLKGREVQVCKKAFANIHGISDKKIRTLCIKHEQNVLFPRDNRGRHSNRPKKVTSDLVLLIKHHILKMLSGPSGNNFVKKDKKQAPGVNISQLYKDFLHQYEPDALDEETSKIRKNFDAKVKSWLYFKVFHEEFNSMDFNTVKRKLSDLRKYLEPSASSSCVKKKSLKISKSKLKAKETTITPSGIPREEDTQNPSRLSPPQPSNFAPPQMGYIGTQQQHFTPNLQLSMLGLQHLNNGSHASSPAVTQQQQQPLNLQATQNSPQLVEQTSSQPFSLNLHPMSSHVSPYYSYLYLGNVSNFISIPASSSSSSTQSSTSAITQTGAIMHQSNVQNYPPGSIFANPSFTPQTNLSVSHQEPNNLQSYSTPQHNTY